MVRIFSKSRRYIDELKSSMKIRNKIDSHKIDSLYGVRGRLIKSRDRLIFLRIMFYIALYASIISSFTSIFNLLPLLSEVLDFILTYIGIVGTTFSILMIFFLSHSIKNYDRDIATIESHILAIHVKHDKSKEEEFDSLMKKIK